jgi:hypothetical protein
MKNLTKTAFGSVAVAGCLLFIGSSPALAAVWEVLVVDQQAPGTKTAPPKWATLVAGPAAVKKADGFLVSIDGKLWQLKVNTLKEQGCCDKGKFPFSYEVDQLTATPMAGGQPTVLMGINALDSAKALMKEHIGNCDEMKPLPSKPATTESYERSKINLLGSVDNSFAFEILSESAPFGRADKMTSDEWAAFNVDKALSPDMPGKKRTIALDAQGKIVKVSATEKDSGVPADISQYAIVRKDLQEQRKAFIAAHPKLVEWDKVSFYTVSPDKSVVVYGLNGNLYWQGATGKPRLLGPVKSVHGLQWHKNG